ncbi:hypothetical protein NSE_0421 [Neorickettsia sennetsu str. Miyayama]|uniref:Uncharacterized protein n=1 Tax=Ehrlichia sennetsu (strain ATCC VR-367 / Miyayama) TaxID=222891 RepID=Q2GDY9_EHRS3|nr:hypothetical protein NSE_0421 [Neorickettsia sennetsu str. Miyayama]
MCYLLIAFGCFYAFSIMSPILLAATQFLSTSFFG